MILKVKKLDERAKLPTRATEYSAGYDLYALCDEPLAILPHQMVTVSTGIAIEMERRDMAAFLFARSSLGVKYGITLSNSVGVIDSDYRGEIKVGLVNLSEEPYTLMPYERFAQMVLMPIFSAELQESSQLSDTQRAEGGFGSTGRV